MVHRQAPERRARLAERATYLFEKDQTLTLPDVLPGFSVPVARFFEE